MDSATGLDVVADVDPETADTAAPGGEPGELGSALPPPVTSGPVAYDFRRPNKVSRDHLRTLQIVNETFARQFSTVLSTALRSVSQVSLSGVQHLTYDEYIRSSPNPSFLALVSLEQLHGVGMLQFPLNLAMAAIDRLLGGLGSSGQPTRALSDIESVLMRDVVQRVLHELSYAYESLTQLDTAIVSLESNPQFAQITAPSEMVVVATFDVHIGEEVGPTSLCLPFAALQPVLDAATGQSLFPDRSGLDAAVVQRALRERLAAVPVDVQVRFDGVSLISRDILELAEGDVLPLRHPVNAPLSVTVAGRVCAHAVPGSKGKRLACRIVDPDPERDSS